MDDEDEIVACSACNGSGMGIAGPAICWRCKGSGDEHHASRMRERDEARADYMLDREKDRRLEERDDEQ